MNIKWIGAFSGAMLFSVALQVSAQQPYAPADSSQVDEAAVGASENPTAFGDDNQMLNSDEVSPEAWGPHPGPHPGPGPHPHPNPPPPPMQRWRWEYSYTDRNGCQSCRWACDSVRCQPRLAGQKMACRRPGTVNDDDVYVCRRQ